MRKIKLTKEEEAIFLNAEIKEEDIQELMKKYSIKKFNKVNYVLCKRRRDGGEKADFMGTKKALEGILQEGEALRDFVEFKLRMKPVLEFRNRDFLIERIKRRVKRIKGIQS